MTRRWLLGVVLLGACGRFDFVEQVPEQRTVELKYPSSATYHAVLSVTNLTIEPMFEDKALTKFTITPDLPAGLTFDESSGKITGTPTESVDRKAYTISATGENAIGSAELTLTVLQGMLVTSFDDGGDASGGNDLNCAAMDGKCTLRAAAETASKNLNGKRYLILLGPGFYQLDGDIKYIMADVAIVGAGAGVTTIRPKNAHDGFRMIDLKDPAKIRLEQLTVADFGPSTGGVALVKRGLFEAHEVEFRNNLTATSGAVLDIAEGAEASFTNVTFVNNDALSQVTDGDGWGGVINATDVNTRVTVDKSTASGNRAVWGSFAHVHLGASLHMSNSTLHHNTVKVAGTLATPSGSFELTNVTLAYNRNENGESDPVKRTAGIYIDGVPGSYKMANSIVAFNTDVAGAQNNCGNKGSADHLDSLGGNLFSDGAGNCASAFTQDGDGLSTDPLFTQQNAGNHGGKTPTIALKDGSPALDRGLGEHCPKEDQRGVARKLSALDTCDAGAFELQ